MGDGGLLWAPQTVYLGGVVWRKVIGSIHDNLLTNRRQGDGCI
jgi:hypothetical protein